MRIVKAYDFWTHILACFVNISTISHSITLIDLVEVNLELYVVYVVRKFKRI